ncbi:uncharacterized protein [Montipora foliosa]|uniref:uncharacterized protein n=1 Tax=Montipora foliosa TaxID=591990 RepID=UPI0035F1AE98
MSSLTVHFSVWLVLVYLFTVSALPASRNFTVVKLFPPSSHLNETENSLVPAKLSDGVMADQQSASLGKQAHAFRLHRPGFEHVPGSVSLESATHPGLYLRYKNYKFHLEKMKPSGLFEKDATFVERKTQTKGAAGYELFNHPGWFMCHDTTSKLGLVAKKLEIASKEFLEGCLYMAVQVKTNPTKKTTANEAPTARATVQEITGDISNAVSTENLPKVNQSKNGNDSEVVNSNDQQNFTNVNNTLTNLQQLEALTDSTSGKHRDNAKLKDTLSVNKTAGSSSNQTAATQLSHGKKKVNITQVANASQNALKVNMNLLNNTNIMASRAEKKLVNQSDNLPIGLSKSNSPDSEPANATSAAHHIQSTLQDAFTAAKQQAINMNLTSANVMGVVAGKVNYLPQTGSTSALKQHQNPVNLPTTPTQAVYGYGPDQINENFKFLNRANQGNKFQPMTNGGRGPTQPAIPGGQLAQIRAKAAALVDTAFKNQQHQARIPAMGQQRPKDVSLIYGQRQQVNLPLTYFKQLMSPPKSLRAPNYITAPAHASQARPLISPGSVLITAPQPQFGYKQTPLTNSGFKFPLNNWAGMASAGRQNFFGGSQALKNFRPTRPFEEKANSKLEDDMSNKQPDKNDKCISLKFINKIRKPIKLVSSMKLGGYLITAETFKLKTIFKHPRKHHHVIFYARDADDIDNEVLLNNNNAIAVTPGGCDLPFRSVLLSHHGQIPNAEIERLREKDEYTASMEAAKKTKHGREDENLSQWTAFEACAASCGRSVQTRTRMCKPGHVCKGSTIQSRICIQTPCPRTTCIKTYTGKCCALPFVFRGSAVNRCIIDPKTNRSWCAVTPNFDKEKRWGYCHESGPQDEKIAPVLRSFLPGSTRQLQPLPSHCSQACARICMSWCPQYCCMRTTYA